MKTHFFVSLGLLLSLASSAAHSAEALLRSYEGYEIKSAQVRYVDASDASRFFVTPLKLWQDAASDDLSAKARSLQINSYTYLPQQLLIDFRCTEQYSQAGICDASIARQAVISFGIQGAKAYKDWCAGTPNCRPVLIMPYETAQKEFQFSDLFIEDTTFWFQIGQVY